MTFPMLAKPVDSDSEDALEATLAGGSGEAADMCPLLD